MRDTACDRYANNTNAQIIFAEAQDLKSTNHALEVCSLLTAYRLFDVISNLDHPDHELTAPSHQRLHVGSKTFKVSQCVTLGGRI
jgi:predicted double-glycine peptidase